MAIFHLPKEKHSYSSETKQLSTSTHFLKVQETTFPLSLQNKEMLTKFSSKLYESVDGHWKYLFTSQINSHKQVELHVMYGKWVSCESLWKHLSEGCLLYFCNKKELAEFVLNSCRICTHQTDVVLADPEFGTHTSVIALIKWMLPRQT